MTQKQYEAGQVIMQMSRIFCKAMRECMENAGLLQNGYELNVKVWQPIEIEGHMLQNTVRLDQRDIDDVNEYLANSFTNHCYEDKGWVVIDDPVCKCGTVPPVVRTMETAATVFDGRKKVEKATPPDGLWISRFDDPYPVDSGVSVNE